MELEAIKKHWDDIGGQVKSIDDVVLTSRDPYLGQLERENILDHLRDCHSVLEIGCGDGLHATEYAQRTDEYHGIDVAQSLLALAEKRIRTHELNNVTFHNASALDIAELFSDRKFDVVISQRCMINLPTWEYQSEVIRQVYQLLEPGGRFLITEGFQGELENLNHLRERMGLEAIKVVDNNRFMNRDVFETFLDNYFRTADFRHYGLYTYLSHLFHPLVVHPEKPQHISPMNETAMRLAQLGQLDDFLPISYNLFYALMKK